MLSQKIGHECALVGVVLTNPNNEIYKIASNGLDALNHRGEEASGIAWIDSNQKIKSQKNLGLRQSAIPNDLLSILPPSSLVIGHTRYSTAGQPDIKNVQPFVYDNSQFAIAHNGNVHWDLIPQLDEPTSDSYGVGKEIASGKNTIEENIINVISKLNGAYVFLFLTPQGIYAVRDPWGFRPLVGGKLNNEINGFVVGSESVGLHDMHVSNITQIPRGILVKINPDGYEEIWKDPRIESVSKSACSFEQTYFADASSISELEINPTRTNHELRVKLGQQLYKRFKPEGDLVVAVPSSGRSYAEGMSIESGIPLKDAIQINRYVGRDFIKPYTPEERKEATFRKYRFIPNIIKGSKLIVVDDSIVRGHTSSGLILNLFDQGAQQINLLLGVPPITHPCYWGIDFHNPMDLIYNQLMSRDENSTFEERLADWLVGGNKHLLSKLQVCFQDVLDYVSTIRDCEMGTPINKSGGCFHCISGVVPIGAITDLRMSKKRFDLS